MNEIKVKKNHLIFVSIIIIVVVMLGYNTLNSESAEMVRVKLETNQGDIIGLTQAFILGI